MNILFLKFFGENFKKIATENPLGFNILSTNVKFIVNFKENTISLKHYNPSSSTKLLELSFTYTNAGESKPLIIKSVNSFKFIEQDNKTQPYTKPNVAQLTALKIPDNMKTAINATGAGNLGAIAETPQNNPNMICLAVEFKDAAVNPGFTAATDIKIKSNYWNFITMASRMHYDEKNSLEIDFNEYSQKKLKKFINEGIISKDQLNNYNTSLSKNSKDNNLYSLRLNSTKSTLIIETTTNQTNILKLGTYATQNATPDNAKILSNMLAPNLVKLNNNALTVKEIINSVETTVGTISSDDKNKLESAIKEPLGVTEDITAHKPRPTTKPNIDTEEDENNTDETSDENTVLPTTDKETDKK